jgi:hypothetical protein
MVRGKPDGMEIRAHSDTVSAIGRAAQDVGMAALLGGNLFGRLAMHPALEGVCGPEERGQVVNRAWRRYGTINSLSLAAIIAGWGAARSYEAGDRFLSERERRLARAKDVTVGVVTVTGLATALAGVRFNAEAPGGAVPLRDGNDPAPETSRRATRIKHLVNGLGRASGAAQLALIGIQGAMAQEGFRRPPLRRVLKQRY